MITPHKFIPAWDLPDLSPVCVKVETHLRMLGLEFRGVVTAARKAREKKCPYTACRRPCQGRGGKQRQPDAVL